MRSKDGWTISQERDFMENLLCTRFNFFLIVYTVILIGAFRYMDQKLEFRSILVLGFIVTLPIGLNIIRAQIKLDAIFGIIEGDPKHPVNIIDEIACGPSTNQLIGFLTLVMCLLILILGFVYSFFRTYPQCTYFLE